MYTELKTDKRSTVAHYLMAYLDSEVETNFTVCRRGDTYRLVFVQGDEPQFDQFRIDLFEVLIT